MQNGTSHLKKTSEEAVGQTRLPKPFLYKSGRHIRYCFVNLFVVGGCIYCVTEQQPRLHESRNFL
jgi:hypothetical protein